MFIDHLYIFFGELSIQVLCPFLSCGLFTAELYVCLLVTQSCPDLCDPMDCSPPGSSVHGILQARRILEWVAIPFSGDLPNQGTEPGSPALQVDSSPSEPLAALLLILYLM